MTGLALSTLAARANDEHAAAEAAAGEAVIHARNAGQALLEAKTACRHGEWLAWLAANFRGSARTAQAYMRVADGWDALVANTQSAAHLSLSGALGLLTSEAPIEKYRRLRDAILDTEVSGDIRSLEDLGDIPSLMEELYPTAMKLLDTTRDPAVLIELSRGDLVDHLLRLHCYNMRALDQTFAEMDAR